MICSSVYRLPFMRAVSFAFIVRDSLIHCGLVFGGHVTQNPQDKFAFRTPPLRNVALTSPYMHNGAYPDLESVLRHHLNPTEALLNYDPEFLSPALQETCQEDEATQQAILETLDPIMLTPLELSDAQISDLLAFLQTLTSPSAIDLSADIPASVPSGLPVRD